MNISLGKTILSAAAATLALAAPAWGSGPHKLPPKPVKNVTLSLLGTSAANGESTAEISAYDSSGERLFTTDAVNNQLRVIDVSDPAAPVEISTISLTALGAVPNSVAYSPLCGGRLVVAVESSPKTAPGTLALFDTDGTLLDSVTTGAQPDNVSTVPGGRRFLSANEGEPSDDGTTDPEGSVGVATLIRCDRLHHRLADFDGVPVRGPVRVFGPGATLEQDLEPEYIAPADGREALVTIQEANAVATLDIVRARITSVKAIGFKDHGVAGNGLDPSDKDSATNGGINIAEYANVFGMHQPDAVASYRLPGDRGPRFISADEGDSRDWGYFSEESRVKDLALDPVAFPASLKADAKLGRLNVTTTLGDTDRDGDYDELYAFGGRGVSIYDERGSHRWDSGDAVERFVAANDPANWNAEGAVGEVDKRSDNKGPELEGITTGTIAGRDYAFAGAERNGGVFAFDLRAVPGEARIAGYVNARGVATSPEGVLFVPACDSPNGTPLVITTNEVSGNVAVYSVS